MRNYLFIAVLCALCFMGCKGGEQNQNEKNAENIEVSLPQINEPIAYKAWLEIAKVQGLSGKYICPANSTVSYTVDMENKQVDEGYMISDEVFCYPLKEGGVLTIHEHIEAAEGQGGEYCFDVYTFKDDKLTKIENFLPVPSDVKEFLDLKKCNGQDDIITRLTELYNSNPKDFVEYFFFPEEQILKLQLHPLSYSKYVEDYDGHPARWLEQYWEMRYDYNDDKNIYKWNGEAFYKESKN